METSAISINPLLNSDHPIEVYNNYCQNSVKKGLKELKKFVLSEAKSNPEFKENIYTYLEKNITNKNDFFERIVKVLYKCNLLDREKIGFVFFKNNLNNRFKDFMNYSQIQSLSTEEIKKILNKYKEFEMIPYAICANYNQFLYTDFQEALLKFFEGNIEKQCFIIYYQYHYISLFIDKDQNELIRIFILDSVSGDYSSSKILQAIQELLDKKKLDFSKISIYIYDKGRQNATYGCSIMSTYDAINFARNPEAMINDALKSKYEYNAKEIKVKCYNFSKLPSKMMRLTQSLKLIQAHDKVHSENVESVLRNKGKISEDGKNTALELKLKKHVLASLKANDMIKVG